MNVHMLGIGGVGMSALAQLYHSKGHHITGCDRSASPTTDMLEAKGIPVSFGHDDAHIAGADLLVYSDALPADHHERVAARAAGVRELSYFAALGEATREMKTVAIAGTHGKTTTTAMLTKILFDRGMRPSAIIGSIVKDFGTNYIEGGDTLVVEACEYRDHILELAPTTLLLNNLEWDHTDYFPSLAALQETFRKVITKLPANGALITNPHDKNIAPLLASASCSIVDYTGTDVSAVPLIGAFNVQNAKAAKTAAHALGVEDDASIDLSLATFKGTWRRLERKGTTPKGALVIDDYAHHPTAVDGTLAALREHFPGRKLVVAFHPHLYSRTRDLMTGFADTLARADLVLLAPIYAAREEPIPGVMSDALADLIVDRGVPATAYANLQDLESALRDCDAADALIVTMGAGDIYTIADHLVRETTEHYGE